MPAVRRIVAIGIFSLLLTAAPGFSETSRKAISNPAPVYPELAKRMHLTGTVKVLIIVGPDGQIKSADFQGGHPVLIDAVRTVLKEWKYAPAGYESSILLEFKF
jgi:TonB family protein